MILVSRFGQPPDGHSSLWYPIHVYQSVNNRDKIPSFFILEIVLFFTLLVQRQGVEKDASIKKTIKLGIDRGHFIPEFRLNPS